jgi:hypothetical protein
MDWLIAKISERLKTHKSVTIFESDIERVWPIVGVAREVREQRNAFIKAFAKANGWSASIRDPGLRVTFRKLQPAEPQAPSRKLAKSR